MVHHGIFSNMSYSPNARGNTFNGNSAGTATDYVNGSGMTLAQAKPVSINGSGQIVTVNVSSYDSVYSIVGLTMESILNSASGMVIDNGRLEGLSGYTVGTPLYIDTTGNLTTTVPAIGVDGFTAGDFIVFCGIVVQNENNMALQDIKILLNVIGQL
jgi:hypothetical protein